MKNIWELIRWRMFRAAGHEAWNLVCMKVAWLLPHRLVMWAFYRVLAHATTGEYEDTIVPDVTAMDAISRWDAA